MDRKRKWHIGGLMLCGMLLGVSLSSAYVSKAESTDENVEEKVVQMYELQYQEPDGDNGFYREKPSVQIVNRDETAITKYALKQGDTTLASGQLQRGGETCQLTPEHFREGESTLEVWMEEPIVIEPELPEEPEVPEEPELPEEPEVPGEPETPEAEAVPEQVSVRAEEEQPPQIIWQEVPDSRKKIAFRVDSSTPKIAMNAPSGFDAWYTDDVVVHSTVVEQGMSGLRSVRYLVNGSVVSEADVLSMDDAAVCSREILVTESSQEGKPISVVVEVSDMAGNIARMIRTLFIDRTAPQISWEGATDYLISSEPVKLSARILEENQLASRELQIRFQNTQNESKEWAENQQTTMELSEEGMYEICAVASDMAGHEATQRIHLTIDKTSPIIRYVDQMNGSYLPYFVWNYKAEDLISDYSSYEYHMKVDGMLYQANERIESEGVHLFTVEAIDAAGNQNQTQAGFVVDHTAPRVLFGNVENGSVYYDAVDVNISTENRIDSIQKIEINGEKQNIKMGSQFYQFPFQEVGAYEVCVSAVDLAGNQIKQTIQFHIQERIRDTLLNPVKKLLTNVGILGNDKKKDGKAQDNKIGNAVQANALKGYEKVMMIIVILIIGSAATWQISENIVKDNKKTPDKRQ